MCVGGGGGYNARSNLIWTIAKKVQNGCSCTQLPSWPTANRNPVRNTANEADKAAKIVYRTK